MKILFRNTFNALAHAMAGSRRTCSCPRGTAGRSETAGWAGCPTPPCGSSARPRRRARRLAHSAHPERAVHGERAEDGQNDRRAHAVAQVVDHRLRVPRAVRLAGERVKTADEAHGGDDHQPRRRAAQRRRRERGFADVPDHQRVHDPHRHQTQLHREHRERLRERPRSLRSFSAEISKLSSGAPAIARGDTSLREPELRPALRPTTVEGAFISGGARGAPASRCAAGPRPTLASARGAALIAAPRTRRPGD